MARSGDTVLDSGIYKCSVCGRRVTCVKGEPFPPCCKGANFDLVEKTKQD